MKLNELDREAYAFICENPGCNMTHIALLFNKGHSIYGKQRAASLSIARLRRAKKIIDCPRCPYCGRALSRQRRNVPLYPTNNGEGGERSRQEDLF